MTLAEQLALLVASGVARARFDAGTGALVEVEFGAQAPAAVQQAQREADVAPTGPVSTEHMLNYFDPSGAVSRG